MKVFSILIVVIIILQVLLLELKFKNSVLKNEVVKLSGLVNRSLDLSEGFRKQADEFKNRATKCALENSGRHYGKALKNNN